MYVLLLIFGAAVTAAGIGFSASGVSIQEHTFDPAILTLGIVALTGGLILIGLGFAIRLLSRIELALVSPIMPSAAQPGEAAAQPSAAVEPRAAAAFPFPPGTTVEAGAHYEQPHGLAASSPSAFTAQADNGAERSRNRLPPNLAVDNAPVLEETDVSLLPKPPLHADERAAEIGNTVVARRTNGNSNGTMRTTPRLDMSARAATRPERSKGFDAFWPRRQRPGKPDHEMAPAAIPEPPAELMPPPSPRAQADEPAPEEPRSAVGGGPPGAAEAAAISVLKSGVVDGMAYTLYSDGSIEAQLPEGLLRFGSIAELRNHIEHGA